MIYYNISKVKYLIFVAVIYCWAIIIPVMCIYEIINLIKGYPDIEYFRDTWVDKE